MSDNQSSDSYYLKPVKENFTDTNKTSKTKMYAYIHLFFAAFAIYLSFQCNKEEFNIGSLVISFFVPYIYIIYIAATKGLNFCSIAK